MSEVVTEKRISALKAIRKYCLQCSDGSFAEVKNCPITKCELYDFRFGHNPNRKGIGGGFRKNTDSANDSEIGAEGVEEDSEEDL